MARLRRYSKETCCLFCDSYNCYKVLLPDKMVLPTKILLIVLSNLTVLFDKSFSSK